MAYLKFTSFLFIWFVVVNSKKIPDDFYLGVATASYQIEGAWDEDGKGENIWDYFTHNFPERIENEDNGDIACDSYHKYKEDIALAAGMGVTHYRFSLSWSRILPTGMGTDFNKKGMEYYQNIVAELLKYNIIPVVTLFHWDLPQQLQEHGGWMNVMIADNFVNYARIVFQNLKNVGYWNTINEPKQVCVRGYGEGAFAPGLCNTGIGEYQCAKVVLLAHAGTYRMYKEEFPEYEAKMAIVLDGEWNEPMTQCQADVDAAERRNEFEFGLYANPIYNGNWPQVIIDRVGERSCAEKFVKSRLPEFTCEEIEFIKGTFDYIGFNTYWTHQVSNDKEPEFDGKPGYNKDIRAILSDDPNWKRGANGNTIVPWGARKMLNWVKDKYNNPDVFVTENGMADTGTTLDDDDRIEFYTLYINAILDAKNEDGVKIFGYTAWSLLDNFEWSDGYGQHFGLYHVDFCDPNRTRTPKKSVGWYTDLIKSRELNDTPSDSVGPDPCTS